MPRHPPNALTSRLKTRTTNDNTDAVDGHTVIKRFFLFPCALVLSGRSITRSSPMPFPRHRSKNPFTMSKTDDRPNAERQIITGASCATANWLPTPWKVKLLARAAKRAAGDGGAYRDRTDDLMLAKQPLSQLS
jgi:hypothetical protein